MSSLNLEQLNLLKEQYELKNQSLMAQYPESELSAYEYFNFIFGDTDFSEPLTYSIHTAGKTWGTAGRYNSVDELLLLSYSSNNISIPFIRYFNSYQKYETSKEIYALAVDIDHVNPEEIDLMLTRIDKLAMRPSLIVNTGNGLQLIWKLNQNYQTYNYRKNFLNILHRKLKKYIRDNVSRKVDNQTGAFSNYRPCGVKTKFSERVRAYMVSGREFGISAFGKFFNISEPLYFSKEAREIHKKEKGLKDEKTKESKKKYVPVANSSTYFFLHCLERTRKETLPGHRETSLFALSIAAYKANVPIEAVSSYLKELVDYWKTRDRGEDNLQLSELNKAIKSGYSPKYMRTSSKRLEELFGWEFFRRGRKSRPKEERVTRAEIVAFARRVKTGLAKDKHEAKIIDFMEEGYSKSEVARKLGMSRQNLYKTYGKIIKKSS